MTFREWIYMAKTKRRNELEDALMQVGDRARKYFRWKFDIPFGGVPMKQETLEEVCKFLGVRNPQYFKDWERTDEYKNLVNIYLNSKVANDILDIYNVVSEKAKKTGDPRAIDTLLKLQKEIQASIKLAKKKKKDNDDDDGLIL